MLVRCPLHVEVSCFRALPFPYSSSDVVMQQQQSKSQRLLQLCCFKLDGRVAGRARQQLMRSLQATWPFVLHHPLILILFILLVESFLHGMRRRYNLYASQIPQRTVKVILCLEKRERKLKQRLPVPPRACWISNAQCFSIAFLQFLLPEANFIACCHSASSGYATLLCNSNT